MSEAKPFAIPKRAVWEAFKRVRGNGGAAGVDDQSIAEFEEDLSNSLYRLWNRLSSGSYFPPAVRRVEIPKTDGGTRPLGIPTVTDRVAQTVVKQYLEPLLEPHFHPDSFGYRPGKSAIQAIGVARQRCWRFDWALDLDIRAFFDTLDHELLLRAVRKHTDCKWVLLYVERWLKAPMQAEDGTLYPRERGTPQGGVISPLLANLYLHYVFDQWMEKIYPHTPFERYADDLVCHCSSEEEAARLREQTVVRLAACGLELNRQKTRVVYCQDSNRRGEYPEISFDFLGYTFRPRCSLGPRGPFVSFSPAVSRSAVTAMHRTVRQWHLHRRTDKTLTDLAHMFNPIMRGWLHYSGSITRRRCTRFSTTSIES